MIILNWGKNSKMLFQEKLDYLVKNGICFSVVYGPVMNKGVFWSVDVLTNNYESFSKPFAAYSIDQCLDIAIEVCQKNGWLKDKQCLTNDQLS